MLIIKFLFTTKQKQICLCSQDRSISIKYFSCNCSPQILSRWNIWLDLRLTSIVLHRLWLFQSFCASHSHWVTLFLVCIVAVRYIANLILKAVRHALNLHRVFANEWINLVKKSTHRLENLEKIGSNSNFSGSSNSSSSSRDKLWILRRSRSAGSSSKVFRTSGRKSWLSKENERSTRKRRKSSVPKRREKIFFTKSASSFVGKLFVRRRIFVSDDVSSVERRRSFPQFVIDSVVLFHFFLLKQKKNASIHRVENRRKSSINQRWFFLSSTKKKRFFSAFYRQGRALTQFFSLFTSSTNSFFDFAMKIKIQKSFSSSFLFFISTRRFSLFCWKNNASLRTNWTFESPCENIRKQKSFDVRRFPSFYLK